MIKWTGLAPRDLEFPFPGSLTSLGEDVFARNLVERQVFDGRTTSASTTPRAPRRTCCPYACVPITVLRASRSCELFPDEFDLHLLHAFLDSGLTKALNCLVHSAAPKDMLPRDFAHNACPPVEYKAISRISLDGQCIGSRKVDARLRGKGNSNSHGTRPVHFIITMIHE